MDISVFITLLFALQLIYWFIGKRASKNLKSKDDYFLAGKSVRLMPLAMTFFATQVGGGVILGAADEAYAYGWPILLYPLGAALGLIALGCGVGKRLAGFQVSTVAQIFEVVYKSTPLKKFASLLSIVSLFMILIAQIIASNKFLISIGFANTPLFILFWAIVIIYTAQGGLKAVISTDVVQAAFFSIVFFSCFAFALYSTPSSSILLQAQEMGDLSNVSDKMCGWLLMPLLFMIIEQDMAQRCFAGASPKIVSSAALLAGVGTMAICVVPVFFGCLARELALDTPVGGSVLMTAIEKTTNPWITAFSACAVLAAIISTATSLINAISSNLSDDFNLSKEGSDKAKVGKKVTCVISSAAIFFAFYFDNIVDLLMQSYELSLCCLLAPISMALFKKQCFKLSATTAIIFGIFGFIFFRVYPTPLPKEIACIALSFLGYAFGELIAIYKLTSQTIELQQNE